MVTRMPLVWGVLISIDKFRRLCSPCPVLASERSFPLPCFFFLISGLPRFLDRLAQSFGQGMLIFLSRYLSHCQTPCSENRILSPFCPLQMIPSLSPFFPKRDICQQTTIRNHLVCTFDLSPQEAETGGFPWFQLLSSEFWANEGCTIILC